MGEARAKEEKRRIHATKIVAAFEQHILALTGEYYTAEEAKSAIQVTREALISILVTPPPK